MDELAWALTGENVHYGTPTNPAAPTCIPGGSSSGSAVAAGAPHIRITTNQHFNAASPLVCFEPFTTSNTRTYAFLPR